MLLSSITIPRSSSLWRSSRETIALFAPHVWDAATELDPAAEKLDQTRQFSLCHPDRLREFFEGAGLADVRSRACKASDSLSTTIGKFRGSDNDEQYSIFDSACDSAAIRLEP